MYSNVPDDWGAYYHDCPHCKRRWHASEGGCDCGYCQDCDAELDDEGTCPECGWYDGCHLCPRCGRNFDARYEDKCRGCGLEAG